MDFTLNQDEYESLVAMARASTSSVKDGLLVIDQGRAHEIELFLRGIESRNGIVRHLVWVQWQEANAPLVSSAVRFPRSWPEHQRAPVELIGRAVAKSDVLKMVQGRAVNPVEILVTRDPAAVAGWSELDDFFK